MIEILIGFGGTLIAVCALLLQRREMNRTSRVGTLALLSDQVHREIDFRERLIQGLKSKGSSAYSQTTLVNERLRPLHRQIVANLLEEAGMGDYEHELRACFFEESAGSSAPRS